MKKLCKFIRSNIKVAVAFIVGGIVLGGFGVYAAVASSSISYSNSASGLSSTNVQSAIDELATKADIRKSPNIVSVYTYNASTCVTGEETTCVKSTCHKSTAANSCKAGDIVKYKVNDTDIVTFHVMYDNGTTMTMQSQKQTIYNVPWISKVDNEATGGRSCGNYPCSSNGPITVLAALENATAGWTNVNNQTYTMGTTSFSNKSPCTGCSTYKECVNYTYALPSRTAKARMITVPEAADLGCTDRTQSCPKWMYNYLNGSTSYGGTVNDTSKGATGNSVFGYWTMNTNSAYEYYVWKVYYYGRISDDPTTVNNLGARAVVVVNK